jgi:hypothetical protein
VVVLDEAPIERGERRIAADGGAGSVEQHAAYRRSSVAGGGTADPLAALPGARRETGQRGDLFAGQPAEFGSSASKV